MGTKRSYFVLNCLQNNVAMHTGFNTTSKLELHQALLGYLTGGDCFDEDEGVWVYTVSLDELCESFDFNYEEHIRDTPLNPKDYGLHI